MSIQTKTRIQAVKIVETYLQTKDFPDRLIEETPGNKGLLIELVYGTVRWLRVEKWVKDRYVQRDPGPTLEAILYIAFYQLIRQEDPAEYAIVNECVQTAKELTNQGGANLINAVLRRLLREKEALLDALAKEPPSIVFSHPNILYDRWVKAFGPEATLSLMKWNNTRAHAVIRVCTDRITTAEYMDQLTTAGIDGYKQIAEAPDFIELPHGVRIVDLPGFEAGHFLVQDPSTATATTLLDAQPGERVLDACAAPGGKALCLAENMKNKGQLVALDLHADRMTRLHENIKRLGLSCIIPVRGDARKVNLQTVSADKQLFDRILLDVPCSNTGVIRRRPDSRWRFSTGRQQSLIQTQKEILEHTADFLKPGGTLVYSTCSLEKEENTQQTESFLKRHSEYSLVTEALTFPPTNHSDGAYAAKLVKN